MGVHGNSFFLADAERCLGAAHLGLACYCGEFEGYFEPANCSQFSASCFGLFVRISERKCWAESSFCRCQKPMRAAPGAFQFLMDLGKSALDGGPSGTGEAPAVRS